MAKKAANVPHRQTHARNSFLYQAAVYLTTLPEAGKKPNHEAQSNFGDDQSVMIPEAKLSKLHENALSAYYASHLKTISEKSGLFAKLSKPIKRSICKRCSLVQISGKTSSSRVENLSRDGRKPWADVLLTTCLGCGMQKRFPMATKRQYLASQKER
jgi:ribonuclease P protein subunit RPR2